MNKYGGQAIIISQLVFLLLFPPSTNLLAASLEKYGSQPSYKSAPKSQTSSRERAIRKAVRGINDADAEKREKLIKKYKEKAEAAMKQERYDEAKFYTEILRRSGN